MTWQLEFKIGLPLSPSLASLYLLMRFNPQGKLLQLWAIPKGLDGQEKPGELNWVHGIAVDSKGDVFLGDINGKRVQKFVRHADPRA